jgi:hypothetical protein
MACYRKRHEAPGGQSYRGSDAQERCSLHGLPFEDCSRAIWSDERRPESLHAHDGSQRAQSLWRTRGWGRQDHHEPHGHANSASRIESDRRREVQPSNRRHAIGRNEAHYADDDREESDEQRCRSHVFSSGGRLDSPASPVRLFFILTQAISCPLRAGERRARRPRIPRVDKTLRH